MPAKRLVAFYIKLLVAEEQDLMREKRPVELLDLPVAERPPEIEAADLGADTGRERPHGDRDVAHCSLLFAAGKFVGLGNATTCRRCTPACSGVLML